MNHVIKNIILIMLSAIFLLSLVCFPAYCVNETENPSKIQKGLFVYFGHYEQDDNINNGPESIVWEIISINKDKAWLISTHCLEFIQFNDNIKENRWERSTIRKWMNEEFFFKAFSTEERDAIVLSNNSNAFSKQYIEHYSHYSWIHNTPEPNTYDQVFLLSTKEYESFKPHPCDYSQHVKNQIDKEEKMYRSSNSLRNRSYWLRSENWDPWSVDTVSSINLSSSMVNSNCCFRPVICVNKEKLNTLVKPFILSFNPFLYDYFREYTYMEALQILQESGFTNISVIGETTKKEWFITYECLVDKIAVGNEVVYSREHIYNFVQNGFLPDTPITIYMSEIAINGSFDF